MLTGSTPKFPVQDILTPFENANQATITMTRFTFVPTTLLLGSVVQGDTLPMMGSEGAGGEDMGEWFTE